MSASTDPRLPQRLEALERAQELRLARARLKADIHASRQPVWPILEDPPPCVMTMTVYTLLVSIPHWGDVRARRLLGSEDVRISPAKRLGELTPRQRRVVSEQLRICGVK